MAVKKIHREDILKASVTVMETQGYERLSVRNIAAELHLSLIHIWGKKSEESKHIRFLSAYVTGKWR